MFQLIKKKNKRRIGKLRTMHGVVDTPFFLPIATKGAVKNLVPEELGALGAQIILGNAYHLWLRPGTGIIKKSKNLHKFMNWNGAILTDSGGYQVFSLAGKRKLSPLRPIGTPPLGAACLPSGRGRRVKISEKGVEFRDPLDGKKYFMTPEKSIEIQLALGSDIIMVLDECPPYPCTREYAKKSLERTTRWAERCRKYFDITQSAKPQLKTKINRPLLFGIIQGGIYKDFRIESARQLLALDFDGYAIGGVAVGEPREKMKKVLKWVLPMLPEEKPRYLMGLGRPEEIVFAVENGIDMFDCVIPTRNARHGSLFVWKLPPPPDSLRDSKRADLTPTAGRGAPLGQGSRFYETINITNEKYKTDLNPIGSKCKCYTCQNFTRAYLRHLFAVGEPLAGRLASIHNLKFYLDLMEILRK